MDYKKSFAGALVGLVGFILFVGTFSTSQPIAFLFLFFGVMVGCVFIITAALPAAPPTNNRPENQERGRRASKTSMVVGGTLILFVVLFGLSNNFFITCGITVLGAFALFLFVPSTNTSPRTNGQPLRRRTTTSIQAQEDEEYEEETQAEEIQPPAATQTNTSYTNPLPYEPDEYEDYGAKQYIVNPSQQTRQSSSSQSPSMPPLSPNPQKTNIPRTSPKHASILGRDIADKKFVTLSQTNRRQGLYMIGVNGTGKSTLIANLIVQDMEQGLGLCLLDPHGDLTEDVLSRVPEHRVRDVILLNLMDSKYPFGLNLFNCLDPTDSEQVALTASSVMHVFEKVWHVGTETPLLSQVLRNVTFTLIQNPGTTFAEIPLLLSEDEVRNKLVANVKNSQVKLFWNQYNRLKPHDKAERTSSTLNKVDAFLTQPIIANIVGQRKTTIDFRRIMDEGKILLVQLSPRLADITSLVGAVIIGQLLNAALSRKDTTQTARRQFNLYADEYQRFATEDFATLLSEARKFGIATTIAHQFLDQLDEANRGASVNAANLVVFRVSGQDAGELAKEFDSTPPIPEQIGWKPVLAPKREVIEHLLKNGHSNPQYLQGAKLLAGLTEVAGLNIDKPQFRQTDNLISLGLQMRAGKQYRNVVELQTELKIVIQRLNTFFYEVMRDRDAAKPFDQQDFTTILKVSETYDIIKNAPGIIPLLCSPDDTEREEAFERIRRNTQGNRKKEPKGKMIIDMTTALRQLIEILAADPIMVDSGQHEPMYDKPRTYADMQNEIATRLANLKNHTAKVKTATGEALIETLAPPAGIAGPAFETRREKIQAHTRKVYCKSRSEVEEEIIERQAELLQQEEKKRRTTEEQEI